MRARLRDLWLCVTSLMLQASMFAGFGAVCDNFGAGAESDSWATSYLAAVMRGSCKRAVLRMSHWSCFSAIVFPCNKGELTWGLICGV